MNILHKFWRFLAGEVAVEAGRSVEHALHGGDTADVKMSKYMDTTLLIGAGNHRTPGLRQRHRAVGI